MATKIYQIEPHDYDNHGEHVDFHSLSCFETPQGTIVDPQHRNSTDVFFLISLISVWIVIIAVGIFSIGRSDTDRLMGIFDYNGKICGYSDGFENKQYLFPVALNGFGVCVESCPKGFHHPSNFTSNMITSVNPNDYTCLPIIYQTYSNPESFQEYLHTSCMILAETIPQNNSTSTPSSPFIYNPSSIDCLCQYNQLETFPHMGKCIFRDEQIQSLYPYSNPLNFYQQLFLVNVYSSKEEIMNYGILFPIILSVVFSLFVYFTSGSFSKDSSLSSSSSSSSSLFSSSSSSSSSTYNYSTLSSSSSSSSSSRSSKPSLLERIGPLFLLLLSLIFLASTFTLAWEARDTAHMWESSLSDFPRSPSTLSNLHLFSALSLTCGVLFIVYLYQIFSSFSLSLTSLTLASRVLKSIPYLPLLPLLTLLFFFLGTLFPFLYFAFTISSSGTFEEISMNLPIIPHNLDSINPSSSSSSSSSSFIVGRHFLPSSGILDSLMLLMLAFFWTSFFLLGVGPGGGGISTAMIIGKWYFSKHSSNSHSSPISSPSPRVSSSPPTSNRSSSSSSSSSSTPTPTTISSSNIELEMTNLSTSSSTSTPSSLPPPSLTSSSSTTTFSSLSSPSSLTASSSESSLWIRESLWVISRHHLGSVAVASLFLSLSSLSLFNSLAMLFLPYFSSSSSSSSNSSSSSLTFDSEDEEDDEDIDEEEEEEMVDDSHQGMEGGHTHQRKQRNQGRTFAESSSPTNNFYQPILEEKEAKGEKEEEEEDYDLIQKEKQEAVQIFRMEGRKVSFRLNSKQQERETVEEGKDKINSLESPSSSCSSYFSYQSNSFLTPTTSSSTTHEINDDFKHNHVNKEENDFLLPSSSSFSSSSSFESINHHHNNNQNNDNTNTNTNTNNDYNNNNNNNDNNDNSDNVDAKLRELESEGWCCCCGVCCEEEIRERERLKEIQEQSERENSLPYTSSSSSSFSSSSSSSSQEKKEGCFYSLCACLCCLPSCLLFCFPTCLVSTLRTCLKFLSSSSYIQTAIHGSSYMIASKDAFFLSARHVHSRSNRQHLTRGNRSSRGGSSSSSSSSSSRSSSRNNLKKNNKSSSSSSSMENDDNIVKGVGTGGASLLSHRVVFLFKCMITSLAMLLCFSSLVSRIEQGQGELKNGIWKMNYLYSPFHSSSSSSSSSSSNIINNNLNSSSSTSHRFFSESEGMIGEITEKIGVWIDGGEIGIGKGKRMLRGRSSNSRSSSSSSSGNLIPTKETEEKLSSSINFLQSSSSYFDSSSSSSFSSTRILKEEEIIDQTKQKEEEEEKFESDIGFLPTEVLVSTFFTGFLAWFLCSLLLDGFTMAVESLIACYLTQFEADENTDSEEERRRRRRKRLVVTLNDEERAQQEREDEEDRRRKEHIQKYLTPQPASTSSSPPFSTFLSSLSSNDTRMPSSEVQRELVRFFRKCRKQLK